MIDPYSSDVAKFKKISNHYRTVKAGRAWDFSLDLHRCESSMYLQNKGTDDKDLVIYISGCGSLNTVNTNDFDKYLKRWEFDTSTESPTFVNYKEWLVTRDSTWNEHIAITPKMLFVEGNGAYIATTSAVTPMT